MTAYWINTFTAIHDEARLARYIELAGPAIRAARTAGVTEGDRHCDGLPLHSRIQEGIPWSD